MPPTVISLGPSKSSIFDLFRKSSIRRKATPRPLARSSASTPTRCSNISLTKCTRPPDLTTQIRKQTRRTEMFKVRGTALPVLGATLAFAASSTAVSGQEPYTIGYISDFSGPFVDTFSPVYDGFRAHVEKINAAGGVNGHSVKVVVRDDQLNATRAASFVRELATSESVNSVWSLSLSSTLPGVYEMAKRTGIPAISSVSAIKTSLPPAADFAYSTGSAFEVAGEVSAKLAASVLPTKGKLLCVTIDSAGGF